MYLITYSWRNKIESSTHTKFSMEVVKCPIQWLLDMQKWTEIYILINAQPITEEQARQIDGKLKGM